MGEDKKDIFNGRIWMTKNNDFDNIENDSYNSRNEKRFPRITYEESSNRSENIDEVLDRLESHKLLDPDPKYKQTVKEQLLMHPDCHMILTYLCMLDDLRLEMGYQASMKRRAIGRSLESLDSPVHYFGE